MMVADADTKVNADCCNSRLETEVREVPDDDDDYFANVGFMFESQQPVRVETFRWDVLLPPPPPPPTTTTMNQNDDSNEDHYHIEDHCEHDTSSRCSRRSSSCLRGSNDEGSRTSTVEIAATTTTDINNTESSSCRRRRRTIQVALHVADDHPGAVQSGHYLWPAAVLLSEYLVHNYSCPYNNRYPYHRSWFRHGCHTDEQNQNSNKELQPQSQGNCSTTNHHVRQPQQRRRPPHSVQSPIHTVIELGAGCGLASLVGWQLWNDTLQYMYITDHDPTTLRRAQDNYHKTTSTLLLQQPNNKNKDCENDDDDDDRNCRTEPSKTFADIPILFESLEWGDLTAVERLLNHVVVVPEEVENTTTTTTISLSPPSNIAKHHVAVPHRHDDNKNNQMDDDDDDSHNTKQVDEDDRDICGFDIILGSDLIYCVEVVRPLFITAVHLMMMNSTKNDTATTNNSHDRDHTRNGNSCFILAQSFVYDAATEHEIDTICTEFHLHRTIVVDFDDDDDGIATTNTNTTATKNGRIQEFSFKQ